MRLVLILRIFGLGLVLSLSAGIPLASAGQDNSGTLQGTISDDTDAVLPGVTVTLTNDSTNRVFSTTASSYGNYTFRKVDPGRYTVVFELAGFSRSVYPGIDILTAQSLRHDASLKAAQVTNTIQVTGTAMLIHLESSTVVQHIPQEQFAS